VNAGPNPVDPDLPPEPSISAAAERARAQLHEEIERVRRGVEEMLAEQQGPVDAELRRELDSIREIDERTSALEQRLDQLDAERRLAEYRIHTDTERMLDSLLHEVRTIADRLEGRR
jgi:hypothetical protein